MILPAVIIKLYCFKLFFEKCFCLNNWPFVFQLFWFWLPQQRNLKSSKIPLLISNSLQNCKPIKQKTLKIVHVHFFIICWIASVTSYYAKMRLKIYKMATSILLKFLTLGWEISRAIWRIEVSDGSFFGIFHVVSFELKLFSDRSFPLKPMR